MNTLATEQCGEEGRRWFWQLYLVSSFTLQILVLFRLQTKTFNRTQLRSEMSDNTEPVFI